MSELRLGWWSLASDRSFGGGVVRAAAVVFAGLASVFALGCGESGEDAVGGAVGGSAAGEPERLVVLFQRQRDPEQTRENAEAAAGFLSERLGMPVTAEVPGSYGASVQALASGQADAAYLSALPFLLARRDAGARLLVAEVRPDLEGNRRTNYDSVWVALESSEIESMADVRENAGDLRVCFTSSTSTSGFVMASLRLVREGVLAAGEDASSVFGRVSFGGGYSQALQEVLTGRADIAAVSHYTVEGPTADLYTTQAERDRLKVIARTPEVPTHLVAASGDLSEAMAERLTEALLALSEERPELLSSVYGATAFRRVDEAEHVRAAVEAVEAVGLPIENLAK